MAGQGALPVLGDHYGRVLEEGQIRLACRDGFFTLAVSGQAFPVDPSSLGDLLKRAAESCDSEFLAFIADCPAALPRPTATVPSLTKRRSRDKGVLFMLLARLCRENLQAAAAVDRETARLNEDPDGLDDLIGRQNYRLAFWRTAGRELGYRRFFDIKELAGLRVEDEDVFQAVHSLPIAWARKGWVQGFRIDHPDGLRTAPPSPRRTARPYAGEDRCPDGRRSAEALDHPRGSRASPQKTRSLRPGRSLSPSPGQWREERARGGFSEGGGCRDGCPEVHDQFGRF